MSTFVIYIVLFSFAFALLFPESILYIFLSTIIVFDSLSIVTPSTSLDNAYFPSACFTKGIFISSFSILYPSGTFVLFIVNNISSPFVNSSIISPFSFVTLFAVIVLVIPSFNTF